MKPLTALVAGILCITSATAAGRQVDSSLLPDANGRAIAEEMERREAGFVDSTVELHMTLTSMDGRERVRRLTWQTLETPEAGEGDRSLTVFHEPRDIAGTAFLSHTHIGRPDDQWLYLPSLKRVKRISSSNMSSAFVGSEFAYEDLLSVEVEKFDYLWLRDEPCGDDQCDVVERRPLYEDSGYSRQVVWVDQSEFRPVRIDYYDRKDQLKKVLQFRDYQIYRDRFWRAGEMRMENRQSGKITVLRFEQFEFDTGMSIQDFDPSALRRLR